MTTTTSKKPWLRRLLIAGGVGMVAAAALIWYLFTLKFDDTASVKADYTVDAMELIGEFSADNTAANQKYTEKILLVNGIVSEVEAADTTVNLKFVDTTTGSYAIFAFQEQHVAAAKQVKPGDRVAIKGSCSGGTYSQILQTTFITFKRCALEK